MAETQVTLKTNDTEKSFSIVHAQKILNSKNNTLVKGQSWELADKNFILKDGIISRRKRDKGISKESKA